MPKKKTMTYWYIYPMGDVMTNESVARELFEAGAITEGQKPEKMLFQGKALPMYGLGNHAFVEQLKRARKEDPRFKFRIFFNHDGRSRNVEEWKWDGGRTRRTKKYRTAKSKIMKNIHQQMAGKKLPF